MTTSIIIATAIYSLYNLIALALFGLPASLSETYYLYKGKWNKGWIFPATMYIVVALMMPSWISISEGSPYQFLAFFAPASIAFVATAPAFKSSSLENAVHSMSAIIAALCSLLWVILVTPYWWIILIWVGIIGITAILSKSCRTSMVYWLEQVAFLTTFTSTIVYFITF